MTTVKKFTLGFQPQNKAFRIDNQSGLIVDALMEARGREISKTFYDQVAESANKGVLSLISKKEGNSLLLTRESIVFTKDAYHSGHVELDEAFAEFKKVWAVIQNITKFRGIRRIGFVAEHRLDAAANSNVELLKTLTKFAEKESPAGFMLHFENRTPNKQGMKVNVAVDGFINTIYDFYDSAMDATSPADGKINANIDYQKYYSPSLDSKILEASEDFYYMFKKELKNFHLELKKFGFTK